MPQRKAAKKSLSSDKVRRKRNLALKRKVKNTTKEYLKAIEANNVDKAREALSAAYKEIDKAAAKNYFHKKKASRHKANLAKKLKSL